MIWKKTRSGRDSNKLDFVAMSTLLRIQGHQVPCAVCARDHPGRNCHFDAGVDLADSCQNAAQFHLRYAFVEPGEDREDTGEGEGDDDSDE